jgi:hypothetical protein
MNEPYLHPALAAPTHAARARLSNGTYVALGGEELAS